MRAQRSDKLFYQHRHSNPLTPEKDPSRTCRFARTKREEEQKVFFLQQERDKKEFRRAGIEPSPSRKKINNQSPESRPGLPVSRGQERRLKQNGFSSKEIEDQLLLAIAGIEPSSLEPALNPALQELEAEPSTTRSSRTSSYARTEGS